MLNPGGLLVGDTELIPTIEGAWGWIGIRPLRVVERNEFGNLLVEDAEGRIWRLTPEDLSCVVVAEGLAELEALRSAPEFVLDWEMASLVVEASERVGALEPGWVYCLKIPAVLGGEFGGTNLTSVPLVDLVRLSGYLAHQIHDLPDGAHVELRVIE